MIEDQPVGEVKNELSCSSSDPTITTITPAVVPPAVCTYWDDIYRVVDFTPDIIVSPDCNDVAPLFVYSINQSSLGGFKDHLKVSIDSTANTISVKAMSGGPVSEETFTLSVTGRLPNGATTTWSFDVWVTPCAAPNALILQPFID